MKKKLFLAQLLAICLLLNSCITRNLLWGSDIKNIYRDEVLKDLLINQNGDELFLVGKKYNYFIKDKKSVIQKLLLLDYKQKLKIDFNLDKKGSIIEVGISFTAPISNLNTEQQNFLQSLENEFQKKYHKKFGNSIKMIWVSINLVGNIIEPDSLQNNSLYKNFASTNLIKNHYKTDIIEHSTPSQTAGKVILTPFTVAADIALLPLYILGVLAMGIGSK